jgi:amidohydrolase
MLDLAHAHFDQTQEIRRHLHAHPELSFEEVETSNYIAAQLDLLRIPHTRGIGGHGIIAHVHGQKPGTRTIALRADFDALPITEANEVPYKSINPGVMHACGHDVHTACLLGAAHILQSTRSRFGGTARLLFQPAEEKLPGGATLMIRDGALQNPVPEAIYGQHVYPSMEAGLVGFRAGKYMASADEIYITLNGRGGHGAMPHQCIDPVVMAARVIAELQTISSRYADPLTPTVLTFGRLNTIGGATNVIPDQIKMEGTFRTMDEKWRSKAHELITTIVSSVAESMGGKAEINIVKGYPVLFNDEPLTEQSIIWARELLGAHAVEQLPMRMTAEDFAWYTHVVPGCFYRLGTGNVARGITSPVHTSTFDIDEQALPIGSAMMAWLAVKRLGF